MLSINEMVKNMETAVKDGKNCVAFIRLVDEESCPVNTPEEVFEAAVRAKVPGVENVINLNRYGDDDDTMYNPLEITNGKESIFLLLTGGYVMKFEGVTNEEYSPELKEMVETIPGLDGSESWDKYLDMRKELSPTTEERIKEFGRKYGPLLITVEADDIEFDDCDMEELSGRRNARAVLEDLARRLGGVVVS